ncbi:MAG: flagellar hook-basal body complex protein FliE [Sideroxydans sp.]|nr:flagellar hook-basal body complex protein FliE [Sideroxydans sp.]
MSVSQVDSLLAQMRSAIAAAQGGALHGATVAASREATGGVDFASALKSSLDSVAQAQNKAEDMQKAFVMGDDKVSLSDVMIQMQKANIQFQTSVQVRNKVVAAYNDIMNMQV